MTTLLTTHSIFRWPSIIPYEERNAAKQALEHAKAARIRRAIGIILVQVPSSAPTKRRWNVGSSVFFCASTHSGTRPCPAPIRPTGRSQRVEFLDTLQKGQQPRTAAPTASVSPFGNPFDKILRQIAHSEHSSSHTICRKISLSVSPSSAHCARRRVSEANRAVRPGS